MSNQLAGETSLYLLQHKDNPVNWYPWGEEAFARARNEDKPIFLSIGYSACHWCHVMERESFEDQETATLLNGNFIAIKVDREERPDVDSIYMRAVQAITGGGGWPMSVWLLPDGRPFFGGTYYPQEPRYGMPAFRQVLSRIIEVYQHSRSSLEQDAGNLTRAIDRRMALDSASSKKLGVQTLESLLEPLAAQYDDLNGGFSDKPKFPPAMTLELLFRLNHRFGWKDALEMSTTTLTHMAQGGIYDQIGGGFHRYSVDARWLVPHFEKMLYDNALLIRVYGQAYQVTGDMLYKQVVEHTVEYVLREMTSSDGGFFSAQDADSEGHEGRFFIWQRDEVEMCLRDNEHYQAVIDYWGMAAGPNFEGKSILWVPEEIDKVAIRHKLTSEELFWAIESARMKLFAYRERRIKPARDEKILTAWNGLMIHSLAQAGRILGRPDFINMARNAANFVLDNLQRDGKLLRTYAGGQARIDAFLEDYAFFTEGLIELYQSTLEPLWFHESVRLAKLMMSLFWQEGVGFCDTSSAHSLLITRPQELTDNATPAGNSSAIAVLLRLAILTGISEWKSRAQLALEHLSTAVMEYPGAFAYLACQMDFLLSEPHEIALIGELASPEIQELLAVMTRKYRPNQIVALALPGEKIYDESPLFHDRLMIDGKATAYVCRNYVCQLPVNSPSALEAMLRKN